MSVSTYLYYLTKHLWTFDNVAVAILTSFCEEIMKLMVPSHIHRILRNLQGNLGIVTNSFVFFFWLRTQLAFSLHISTCKRVLIDSQQQRVSQSVTSLEIGHLNLIIATSFPSFVSFLKRRVTFLPFCKLDWYVLEP